MTPRTPARTTLALTLLAGLAVLSLGAGLPAPPRQDTATPTVYQRPLLTLVSYSPGGYGVTPGDDFTLSFRVLNAGGVKARNIVFSIVPGDFLPLGTGGVIAGGVIAPGADTSYSQGLFADSLLASESVGTLQIQAAYTDDFGGSYSETFNLTFPVVKKPASSGGSRPTATATPSPRPILLIHGYGADLDPLKPGSLFTLSVQVSNAGGTEARGITFVLGGGTVTDGAGGTPGPGGGSGISGTGSLDNFAPLGQSNVAFLGNLGPGALVSSVHELIVNSTTAPGAYPLKLTLIYRDPAGQLYTDDHVITLLVYSPPLLELGFYQPPEPLFVGQPGNLPLQVLNLDRKAVILTRMRVASEGAEISNGELAIGYLDTGISFTLDAQAVPFQAGPLPVVVTVDYIDDFNEPRTIQQTLEVEVIEFETPPEFPEPGGQPIPAPQAETFWDKVLRFLRGLLGLDSAPAEQPPLEGELPGGGFPEGPGPVIPGAPGAKG
jgi:hypothetical protein